MFPKSHANALAGPQNQEEVIFYFLNCNVVSKSKGKGRPQTRAKVTAGPAASILITESKIRKDALLLVLAYPSPEHLRYLSPCHRR